MMGLFDHLISNSYDDTVEGEDYYLSEKGYRVMTEQYLVKRGYCCANGCRHCPYDPKAQKGNRKLRYNVAQKYNR